MKGGRQPDEPVGYGAMVGQMTGNQAGLMRWDLLSWLTLAVFALMSLLSVWHIVAKTSAVRIPPAYLGALGWTFFALATATLGRRWWRECLLIFVLFFSFGFATKAYLEPISDQLDHLYRTQERCRNWDEPVSVDQGGWHHSRNSHGLWHYSMNSLFVCEGKEVRDTTEAILLHIDVLQGLYIGLSAVIIFLLCMSAGLPARWAFFALMVALLFLGTSKFSFFRYYSYGPTFSSQCLYWLWIACFFFNRSLRQAGIGLLFALAIFPVLYINHIQESVFLIFLVSFWLLLNIGEFLHHLRKPKLLALFALGLVLLFFVLPQAEIFQNAINISHLPKEMVMGKEHLHTFQGSYSFPKLFDPRLRLLDTMGAMGVVSLMVTPLLLFWRWRVLPTSVRHRIVLLGALPLLVIAIPLYNAIWMTNVILPVYYRILYSSTFWCTLACFLFMVETWLTQWFAGNGGDNAVQACR